MWYVKNVPLIERGLRAALGVAMAFAGYQLAGRPGAVALGIAGLMTALTGVVGFCPACAMVGRRPQP